MPQALDVPVILQPNGKPYCGPACAQMVLAFQGYDIPLENIVSSTKTLTSVDITTLGTCFLEKDFIVTIELWLRGFPNRFIGLTSGITQEILQWCHEVIHHVDIDTIDRNDVIHATTIPRFIEQGGRIVPKPFSLRKLRAAIKKRCPPILNLNMATIYQCEEKDAGHYVIPTRVTQNTITLIDPNHGIKTYPTELILHACYTWTAGVIFIEPR